MEWKEKQLGNISISLSPEENSVLKRLKKGKTLLNLLFVSTTGSLMFNPYLGVNFSSDKQWLLLLFECLNSNNDLIVAIVFWVGIYHWVFIDVNGLG